MARCIAFYIVSLCISYAFCETCVTYNFESDFDNLIGKNGSICQGQGTWESGSYSSIEVESPNVESSKFALPNTYMSCASTFVFPMEAGGTVEVLVYMDSNSYSNQLTVLVNQIGSSANYHPTVASVSLRPSSQNFKAGWQTLTLTLYGAGTYDGYISFLGMRSSVSMVLIDSFRYIPPNANEDNCLSYGDNTPSTTQAATSESTTTTAIPVTKPLESGQCLTYDFGSDFDNMIGQNGSVCQGQGTWESRSYSTINVESPNAESTQFALPNTFMSCASTFVFPMEAGGTVEVLVYMDSNSYTNQLTVLVNQILSSASYHPTVASMSLRPSSQNFKAGWQTITLTLYGFGTYDGYISFLGMRSTVSMVLIDSFRYIPPNVNPANCLAFEDDVSSTTGDETAEPTATTAAPVTKPLESDQCFIYEFGSDFDSIFTNDRKLCEEYLTWSFGNYSDVKIDSVSSYRSFLSPDEYLSCVSSFTFQMSPDGIVEVKVYIEPTTSLDHIIVLAKKVVASGIDTVAGFVIYEPSVSFFINGWNTIRFSLMDLSKYFDGYLIFLGQAAEGSIVLVDSFKYIPPGSTGDDEYCDVFNQFLF